MSSIRGRTTADVDAMPGPSSAPSGAHDAAVTEESPLLSRSRPSSAKAGSSRRFENVAPTQSKPALHPTRAVAISISLLLLIFVQSSNMSGMTLIQGAIAAQLDAYEAAPAMWFSSAYLIAMSSLTPVTGRLATIFPPRSLVVPVATLVAAGSLLCALASSFVGFVLGRVVAGAGGAGVLTLVVVLGLELTSDKTRGLVMGLVNAGFTAGVCFGAIVYGWMMPVIGWRPIFWIQVPLALIAGLGLYLSIPSTLDSDGAARKGLVGERLARVDYLGAVLLITTIVLFLSGLADEIEFLPLALSLVTLSLFLAVEFHAAVDPIIPVKVLSSRGVLLSCLAQLGLMSARWSILLYAPIFMLAVRGATPAAAGSILIPTNVGFGLGGVLVGWLHVRRSGAFWLPSIASLTLFSLSLYALSLGGATAGLPDGLFILAVLVNGLATGAVFNYTLAHILHLSHEDTHYVATSLLATFRGFGGSFGTAIGGGIFYRLLRSSLISGFLKLDGGDHLNSNRQRLISDLVSNPGLVHSGELGATEQMIATEGYAGASRGVWQAAAILGGVVVLIQAATGWTSPRKGRGGKRKVTATARPTVAVDEGLGKP